MLSLKTHTITTVACFNQTSELTDSPGSTCTVRNIWTRTDAGSFTSTYTASQVASHDSAFLLLTCN